MDPQQWMKKRLPNCRVLDEYWTFARYDFPENVRQWIRENWVKVSDEGGGTYHEPSYYREFPPPLPKKEKPKENPEEKEDKENPLKEGQAFAQEYKKTQFYDDMDDANKKATDVMAEQGMEAAVKHMFTDQNTGRTLSYAEMRSRYG